MSENKKVNLREKLTSRKFWAAVSGVVISVMVMFGASSGEQELVIGTDTPFGVYIYAIYKCSTIKTVCIERIIRKILISNSIAESIIIAEECQSKSNNKHKRMLYFQDMAVENGIYRRDI